MISGDGVMNIAVAVLRTRLAGVERDIEYGKTTLAELQASISAANQDINEKCLAAKSISLAILALEGKSTENKERSS